MAWPIDEELSPTRRRLGDYATRHQLSGQREHQLVEVAAGHVGLTLDHLAVATDEALKAEAECVAAFGEHRAGMKPGITPLEGERLEARLRSRRAYSLLHYKIDTFYVWARTQLDDVAALLNTALPRSKGGEVGRTHKGVLRSLESVATNEGITGWEPVTGAASDLTERVKSVRDTYVVHRSSLKPRALRSMSMSPEGAARMSFGGIMYPKEGEEAEDLTSEDPRVLMADLEGYVDAVLDLLEPLAPRRTA